MIRFYNHSGIHALKAEQTLQMSIEEAWDFFSKPGNLQLITPPAMKFKITNPAVSNEMFAGQIITYKVSPLKGLRTSWVTEITQVEKHLYFIDEQRFGPYKLWHHQHWFKKGENGTIMTDMVHYKLPLGPFGRVINNLFVKKKLKHIFEYRSDILNKRFNTDK